MKPIKKYLILFILSLAVFLRGYKIDTLPALNPDEAALGYNAYSLILTGKDEHGASWPLHFKSFGDYKPGGYVYLAIPFVNFLGLTPLAVRLPNLILSTLTIFIVYKLILLLTLDTRLSLLTALVLAINPWHIHFSRGAWESSAALFFITYGIYSFYSYVVRHKSYYLYLFSLSFVASLYIYHSARIISPFLVLFILITNYKLFLVNFKKFFLPCLIAVILTVPVAFSFIKNGGTTRFGGVGLTADYGPVSRAEELLNQHGNTQLINRIIHNKRVLYSISWAEKYFSHFDFNFLFVNGDEVPRSKSPDMGQLYLIELPLLLLGVIITIRQPFNHIRSLILALLLIAPLASSLTFQAPSALRALPLVIPLSILIAVGINFILSFKRYLPISYVLLIVIYTYSLGYFLDAYFIHSPQRYPYAWNTGFSEIIPYVESQKPEFENIYFTNKYDQPYILYLFFSRYYPPQIQSQIQLTPPDHFGFSTVDKIDNITFHIPQDIPRNSLVIDASDYQLSGKSFKIYTK